MNKTALVIPVKAFSKAKLRLSPELDAETRQKLAYQMATNVVRAAQNTSFAPFTIYVICDDETVASWAKDLGIEIIWSKGHDLNGSIELAAQTLSEKNYQEIIVAHADLPDVKDFSPIFGACPISIAPDRHKLGTNVIRVPLNIGFKFCYGPNSFELHLKEAERLGLEVELVEKDDLALDVDFANDLNISDLDISDLDLPENLK